MKIYVQNVIISEWITQYSPSSSWWSKLCAQESPLAGCRFPSTLENQEASCLQTSSYLKLMYFWKCKVGDFLFRLDFSCVALYVSIDLNYYFVIENKTYLTGLRWLFSYCIFYYILCFHRWCVRSIKNQVSSTTVSWLTADCNGVRRVYGSWRHKHKIAAHTSGIFWIHFCTSGGNGGGLSIFT